MSLVFKNALMPSEDQIALRLHPLDSMKPIFKNHSLQNIFVLIVGYFGLMFVRQAFDFWEDEEWVSAVINGGISYCLFGLLLGFPPFPKLMK